MTENGTQMNKMLSTSLIMHIDADAFFASVEEGFNPLLRGRPIIVGGSENQRGVVHTASYAARAKGIRTGMALMKAKDMCPDAVFLKGNYQHYQAASDTMQRIYRSVTPAVEFTSLDDAYLDLTGTLHLHPPLPELARSIQQKVYNELGITVSVGVGSTKLISRIASGLHKPAGIHIVEPGSEEAFLSPLPVEELPGVGHVMREKLLEMQVFTVGDLRRIPLLVMTQLFGINGQKLFYLARGIDKRPVKEKSMPSQISRETTFEEDLNDTDIILATLQYLTERIGRTLYDTGLMARTIGIKIRYSDFKQKDTHRRLPFPTNSSAMLFATVQELFQAVHLRRVRVRHVGVQTSRLMWDQHHLALFNEQQKMEALTSTVDHIRKKFGFMSILPADNLLLKKKYKMEKSGFILHSPALTR